MLKSRLALAVVAIAGILLGMRTSFDPAIAASLHDAAIRLVEAVGYSNAGTVEFLVEPESSSFAFIECNPRIHVEHTITEQVTGIDLVEAQLAIAGGATLEDLGIRKADIRPRGFSIQSRVVALGAGSIAAYKEPSDATARFTWSSARPPPMFSADSAPGSSTV